MKNHRAALWPQVALLAIGGLLAAVPAAAELPVRDDLVLWLDAGQAETLERDDAGRVRGWVDRGSGRLRAVQEEPAARPRWVAGGLGDRPVVLFEGRQFLNLGRFRELDFPPGEPFTIVVVYRLAPGQYGTWLARGGGAAEQRSYQFYMAPGRLGGIAYGRMREAELAAGAGIAVLRCDGSQASLFADGRVVQTFDAGRGRSHVDVLIGARREHPDNTGIFYPLHGQLAELLVYRRALEPDQHQEVGRYLADKYGLLTDYCPDVAGRLERELARPPAAAGSESLIDLAHRHEGLALLETALEETPSAAWHVAELLVRIAEQNRLEEPWAQLAARLLDHPAPFVRGLAEWALAMKVGHDNNGAETVWPAADAPAWWTRWQHLSGDSLLEADWVRQAYSTGAHRQPEQLAASVGEMIARLERMVAGGAFAQDPAELDRLRQIRQAMRANAPAAEDPAAEDPAAEDPNHWSVELEQAQRQWLNARRVLRDALLQQPLLDIEQLLFIRRSAPHTVANITRAYSWRYKPGGDLRILDGLQPDAPTRDLIDGRLGPGHVRGMDLGWDGTRIVFSYARQADWPPRVDTTNYYVEGTHVWQLRQEQEPMRLYEIACDGSNLIQRTHDPYWSDFEPTWTATGDIVFSSDRAGRSQQCGAFEYDHSSFNLYRLTADGQIRLFTDSKDTDRYPHSLDNGLIAFTRWEYQERHFMEVHSVWTARPDGTAADALYKHHMPAPLGLRDVRSMPGTSDLVAIAAGHHTYAFGPVVTISPRYGLNNEAGLRIVTPGVRPQEGGMAGRPVAEGGVDDRGGLYKTPWALSDTAFLAAYAYARPNCSAPCGADSNAFAIYYLDSYGNKELIYRDLLLSCSMPIPLRPRPRPPVFPETTDPDRTYATLVLGDVYQGMDQEPRGSVAYLRVAQRVGWPYTPEHGQMTYISGDAWSSQFGFWSWAPVRVIGDVPVEADGSAHFLIPANTAVYFQALDRNRMEIRRMRSMVSGQAGEVRGCVGCHETRAVSAAPRARELLALSRPASVPDPPPWGAERLLGYQWLVQPIFDRHCLTCHGHEEPAGGLELTSRRADDGFLQSFRSLFPRQEDNAEQGDPLVSVSNRFSDSRVTQPREFGSHRSRLVQVLREEPQHADEVALSESEWTTLLMWIDANAPYFDTFYNKRPADGGAPRRQHVDFPLPPPFNNSPTGVE